MEEKMEEKMEENIEKDNKKNIKTLHISNLDVKTTSKDLEILFGRFGTVYHSRVIVNHNLKIKSYYGFVEMDADKAQAAIEHSKSKGLTLLQRKLSVEFTHGNKSEHSETLENCRKKKTVKHHNDWVYLR